MARSQSVVQGPLGVPEGFPRGSMAKCGSGTSGVPEGFPKGSMAGSQSVVRGLWGSLRRFQGGPWLVPKVWFGDPRVSMGSMAGSE